MYYYIVIRGLPNSKQTCYSIELIQSCNGFDSTFKYLRLTFNHVMIVNFQTFQKVLLDFFFLFLVSGFIVYNTNFLNLLIIVLLILLCFVFTSCNHISLLNNYINVIKFENK